MIYDSVEEATNRLSNTVVTYEDRPVFVSSVESHEDGVMRLRILEWPFSGSPTRKKINSPAFKRFQTPPLGFLNHFGREQTHTYFCERIPSRQRQQGLSSTTFSASTLIGNRGDFATMYTSDAFREMVAGEYPAFDDALPRLVVNSSIAVDREFALLRTPESYVHLYHKRDNVGVVIRGGVFLRPDRAYLSESIIENPNLPNRVEVM